jgi:hypothetical protein
MLIDTSLAAWESQGRSDRASTAGFEDIQRIVRRHYQWVVLHDFLPTIVGSHAVMLCCRSSLTAHQSLSEVPLG